MAKTDAVWGIDIGQCAIKALRCRPDDDPSRVIADAFDYIEYPKILGQPEANPDELIQEALTQFLSRNSVAGDRVAISVPGQSGLARFIKLPPVESKKIPDIVKYEARQQIPFALEDVVWDYQQMVGGSEEDGFALETEVGLFAMKRDQVQRSLEPFDKASIEVDFVQLTPLALYNFIAFDQLQDLPPPEEFDPENPPGSVVLLSLGTETTDLVVTNGYRVWQRSIPLGGTHFTRALTKELKLTYAKAEHLKRHVGQSDNMKTVFKAMRPVFSDLLTEVQRSLGYFSGLDRNAKISHIVGLGNAMKLPGLRRFLTQNLGHEVKKLDAFQTLSGPSVVDAPAFKDNVLTFATCYGLALQGLRETPIKTNLIPREIVQERLIRDKKPWAVGAAAVLLLGLSISCLGTWNAARQVSLEDYQGPMSQAQIITGQASQYQSEFSSAKDAFGATKKVADNLLAPLDTRSTWLELVQAVNLCIPKDPERDEKPLSERDEVVIVSMDCIEITNVATWYNNMTRDNRVLQPPEEEPAAEAAKANPADEDAADDGFASPTPQAAKPKKKTPPSGPGWIFELEGYHFHNSIEDIENSDAKYVVKTLLKNLAKDRIPLREGGGDYPVGEMGIACPLLLPYDRTERFQDIDPNAKGGEEKLITAERFKFKVQFCWQPPDPAKNAKDEAGRVASLERGGPN